jgi:hypothetical protein
MALARSNWRASSVQEFTAGASVADILSALKTLIDAEVAANPSTYKWSVSDYDATNGTLEIKSNASGVASMRVLFFGGRTPSAAAVTFSSAEIDGFYCCVAPAAATTGPDADYASGSPYASDSTQGVQVADMSDTISAADRLRYFENDEQFVLVINDRNGDSDTAVCLSGAIVEHPVDGRVYGVCTQSGYTIGISSGIWSQSANLQRIVPTGNAESTNYPKLVVLRSGSIKACQDIVAQYDAAAIELMQSVGGNTRYYVPVQIVSDAEYVGDLRQAYIGPKAMLGLVQRDGGDDYGYAISSSETDSNEALWLTN